MVVGSSEEGRVLCMAAASMLWAVGLLLCLTCRVVGLCRLLLLPSGNDHWLWAYPMSKTSWQ